MNSAPYLWGKVPAAPNNPIFIRGFHQTPRALNTKSRSKDAATFSQGFGGASPTEPKCVVFCGTPVSQVTLVLVPQPRQCPALPRPHTHLGLGFSSGHHGAGMGRGKRNPVSGVAPSCPQAPGGATAWGLGAPACTPTCFSLSS